MASLCISSKGKTSLALSPKEFQRRPFHFESSVPRSLDVRSDRRITVFILGAPGILIKREI